MTIKSFRGQLSNNGQDTIPLHTNNGSTGYRINKIQMLPQHANKDIEGTIKIYSANVDDVTTPTVDIDFNESVLLAAGIVTDAHSHEIGWSSSVVFDQVTFNQDIYVTWKCSDKVSAVNYYIELEQVKLNFNENTVATLKDIRNIEGQ